MGAIAVVLIVAGLASYLPARKVVAESPMQALQSQQITSRPRGVL